MRIAVQIAQRSCSFQPAADAVVLAGDQLWLECIEKPKLEPTG